VRPDTIVPGAWSAQGAKPHDLAAELHADAPAHADDDGLAVHRLETLFELVDDVLRSGFQAFLGADHSSAGAIPSASTVVRLK